jgi:hypothetical protein
VLEFRQPGPDCEVLVSTLTEVQYHALRENSLFGMIRSILSELTIVLTTLEDLRFIHLVYVLQEQQRRFRVTTRHGPCSEDSFWFDSANLTAELRCICLTDWSHEHRRPASKEVDFVSRAPP